MNTYSNEKPSGYSTHRSSIRSLKRRTPVSEHPLFPTCDGECWQGGRDLNARQQITLQFLEAYFDINMAYARLVALRKRFVSKVPVAQERKLLREIERTIVAREKLEDLHASHGVFVTPSYRDGFTIDLRFSDGRSAPKRPPVVSSASVRIVIPLPPGFRSTLAKANT